MKWKATKKNRFNMAYADDKPLTVPKTQETQKEREGEQERERERNTVWGTLIVEYDEVHDDDVNGNNSAKSSKEY